MSLLDECIGEICMSSKIRKRREKLWIEGKGKCYWCGITTVMPTRGKHENPASDNLATIDHLRSRFDHLWRLEPNITNEERTVLSCWACNNTRGILHQKAIQPMTIKILQGQLGGE
jgi:hypothetical protein